MLALHFMAYGFNHNRQSQKVSKLIYMLCSEQVCEFAYSDFIMLRMWRICIITDLPLMFLKPRPSSRTSRDLPTGFNVEFSFRCLV